MDPQWFGYPWIGIRIGGNADPDRGTWKLTKLTSKPCLLPFTKALMPCKYGMLFDLLRYLKYILHSTFSTLSRARTHICIRIRMDPHLFGSLNPDTDLHWDKKLDPEPGPHWNHCRFKHWLIINYYCTHIDASQYFLWNIFYWIFLSTVILFFCLSSFLSTSPPFSGIFSDYFFCFRSGHATPSWRPESQCWWATRRWKASLIGWWTERWNSLLARTYSQTSLT